MRKRSRPEITTDLFRGSLAIACGALTRKELRDGRFLRIFRDVYTHVGVQVTHELRCRAAAQVVSPDAVLTARSAATVLGVPLARPYDPVELVVPRIQRSHRRPGLNVRCQPIRPRESLAWHDIRIATPARLAFDLLLRRPPRFAVGDVDAVLRAGLTTTEEIAKFAAGRHDHGIVQARRSFLLLDPRAESPPESEVRVLLVLAGLSPVPQLVVRDRDGFVARVDLGFEEQRVAVEYDGAWHADARQLSYDRRRLNRLSAAGWEVVFVTAEQLRTDPNGVVLAVRQALARAH